MLLTDSHIIVYIHTTGMAQFKITTLNTVTCSSNVHTERIVAFILERWLRERAVILRYAYVTQRVLVCDG